MKIKYFLLSFLAHCALFFILIFAMKVIPTPNKPIHQMVRIKTIMGAKPSIKNSQNEQIANIATVKKQEVDASFTSKQKPVESNKKDSRTKEIATSKALQKKDAVKTESKKNNIPKEQKAKKIEDVVEKALASLASEMEATDEESVSKALSSMELGNSTGAESVYGVDYGSYIDIVGGILRSQWFFPNLGRTENIRTTVRIFIEGTGRVVEARVERSSGREDFDMAAMRAVQQYPYFPVPPGKKAVDFLVNFNLLEE